MMVLRKPLINKQSYRRPTYGLRYAHNEMNTTKKNTDEGSEKAIVDSATANRQANKARLPPIRSDTIPENTFPTIEPTAPQANLSTR